MASDIIEHWKASA